MHVVILCFQSQHDVCIVIVGVVLEDYNHAIS